MQHIPTYFACLSLFCIGYKLEGFGVKAEFIQSTVQCFFQLLYSGAMACPWREIFIRFLNLEPLAQETQAKTNKTENDSVTFQP